MLQDAVKIRTKRASNRGWRPLVRGLVSEEIFVEGLFVNGFSTAVQNPKLVLWVTELAPERGQALGGGDEFHGKNSVARTPWRRVAGSSVQGLRG